MDTGESANCRACYFGGIHLLHTLIFQRENKKGQLEVTLLYTSSEDGLNDIVQLTVNRYRCSVQTMQEQEQHKGTSIHTYLLCIIIVILNKLDIRESNKKNYFNLII